MNKVIPLSILTCDCCASTGLIRKCRLKNCNYKMCMECNSKYYIKGQHVNCPACRRNVYSRSNRIFSLPVYFKRNRIGIIRSKIKCERYAIYSGKFIILLCQISYFFFILCVFRYVYHLHCDLFILGSCNEPFISFMFIPYSIFGMCISFQYICILSCLCQICCVEHDRDEDYVY
jgi:hypothetical protein